MKVFISWSGERSRAVAELLSDWIRCVLQAVRPWISTRDIDRGALWFTEIGDQLKDTAVGIICLTNENKNRPWILFEAGALAKGLSSNRVCTFLIDLSPADVEDPLAQFNHTLPEREGVKNLVRTLNRNLGADGLDDRILDQVFTTYWPQFEATFNEILKTISASEKVSPRSEKHLLAEILDNTRSLHSRIRVLEAKLGNDGARSQDSIVSDDDRRPRLPATEAEKLVRRLIEAGKQDSEIVRELLEYRVPGSWAVREIRKAREMGTPPSEASGT